MNLNIQEKIKIVRTDPWNTDFIELTKKLDSILQESDGEEHEFYAQYNNPVDLDKAVIIYINNDPAACGAIKKYSGKTAEIKRMYVQPEYRRKGFAGLILNELEKWSSELNYSECILETGRGLIAAVNLYKVSGYKVIPNYGQYKGVDRSMCFRKVINE